MTSAEEYCAREGIVMHRFTPNPDSRAWDALLGEHKLCKKCGYCRLNIAHSIPRKAKR